MKIINQLVTVEIVRGKNIIEQFDTKVMIGIVFSEEVFEENAIHIKKYILLHSIDLLN